MSGVSFKVSFILRNPTGSLCCLRFSSSAILREPFFGPKFFSYFSRKIFLATHRRMEIEWRVGMSTLISKLENVLTKCPRVHSNCRFHHYCWLTNLSEAICRILERNVDREVEHSLRHGCCQFLESRIVDTKIIYVIQKKSSKKEIEKLAIRNCP